MAQPPDVDRLSRERSHDWQNVSSRNARVLLKCLRNTMRLATGPAEVAGVFRFLFRLLLWRLRGSSGEEQDQTLRLQGVTHVVGLGSGELLTPQEIYWESGYDRLPDFVPQPGWTVLDVGANSGVYAVRQARRGARVYAFEPNPDCYRRLQKSVRANHLEDRVTATNCALGAVTGIAELSVPEGLTTMGSLRPVWGESANGVNVKVDTIDRIVDGLRLRRIDLLKIDVEGLELEVLQGAHSTFPLVDRVVVEYHSLDLGRRVVDQLAHHGLTMVLDDKMYDGDEDQYRGVGRGLLFAARSVARHGDSPVASRLHDTQPARTA